MSNIVHSHNLDSENRFNYDSSQSPELGNADTSSNDELIKQLRSEIDTLSNQLSDLNSNDISYKGSSVNEPPHKKSYVHESYTQVKKGSPFLSHKIYFLCVIHY